MQDGGRKIRRTRLPRGCTALRLRSRRGCSGRRRCDGVSMRSTLPDSLYFLPIHGKDTYCPAAAWSKATKLSCSRVSDFDGDGISFAFVYFFFRVGILDCLKDKKKSEKISRISKQVNLLDLAETLGYYHFQLTCTRWSTAISGKRFRQLSAKEGIFGNTPDRQTAVKKKKE